MTMRSERVTDSLVRPTTMPTDEREEFTRLRQEVRTLRMERDILKKRSWARAAHPAA